MWVRFVGSKAKVCPIKSRPIAELEITAAELGKRLAQIQCEVLEIDPNNIQIDTKGLRTVSDICHSHYGYPVVDTWSRY